MKVSIIIPVYNVSAYLDNCLSSAINQTFRDIEIIVVNDGSTDSSLQIMEAYARKDDRIVIINKVKNEGLIYARKSGVEMARGEYVFHLDGDDTIPLLAIESLYEGAVGDPDLVVGDFCVMEKGKPDRLLSYHCEQKMCGQDFLYACIQKRMWSVCGKLIRRTLYSELIYAPISIGEDLYQIVQLAPQANKVVTVSICVYNYQLNEKSMTHGHCGEVYERNLELVEAVYALLESPIYKKPLIDLLSFCLLHSLLQYCLWKKTKNVYVIIYREFFKKKDIRAQLWNSRKKLYVKCSLFLLFPWIFSIKYRVHIIKTY